MNTCEAEGLLCSDCLAHSAAHVESVSPGLGDTWLKGLFCVIFPHAECARNVGMFVSSVHAVRVAEQRSKAAAA